MVILIKKKIKIDLHHCLQILLLLILINSKYSPLFQIKIVIILTYLLIVLILLLGFV